MTPLTLNIQKLISSGYLASDYTNRNDTVEYMKAAAKYLQKNYPGYSVFGTMVPNVTGFFTANIYTHGFNSNGNPEHITIHYYPHGGNIINCGTTYGSWYYYAINRDGSSYKLQTARKIWGQSFDGTADISGTLSGVAHIQFSADNTYNIGSNSAASRYIYTYWLGAKSGQKLELGANNSDFGQGLCIDTNLNVGIGTNTPTYKLHVNGTFRATNSTVSDLFVNTGDATLKIYTGITTDAQNDGNICFQTSIDATDGQSHAHPTQYQSRCNIVLQPRGGQVYIGTNPGTGNTTYKLYVNSKIFSNGGFVKNGSSDSYVLLGGGGHKAVSAFAPSSHSHNYAANENYGGFTKSGRLPISGFYQSNASESGGNAPWSGWMHLINCQHSNTGNNYALQIAASFSNNNTFKIRVTNNNVNNAWRDIIHSGNIGSQSVAYASKAGSVAWDSITGKPSSFTPSAHTHSWTSITDKLVAGNEFNIVNAGFNNRMWFNYVPINDRSKTATILDYGFGNGHQGYATVTASGFVKSGSSSSYVLLGNGDHQTISSLSVNHALFADYICSGTLPTPANNTVKAYKDSLAKFFKDIRPNGGVGANVNVSASIINNWSNDSATYYDSSTYCFIKIGGSYAGATYGQFLLSSYNLSKIGIVGRNSSQWSKIKWLAYEDQIPTDNNQLANGAGYITSAGSCAYATSAGNADTVDGYHVTAFNDKPWGYIPAINLHGYMDIGKHLEFHYDNTTGSDYSTILRCTGNYANTVNLPSESGTLALTKDVLIFSNESADYLSANFNNPDFSKKAASKHIECWDNAGGWWNWMAGKFMKAGSSDAYVLLGGGSHKLESSLRVAYASNADTVDGHHVDDILPYGLENLCIGAVASGGQTILNSDGSITTSGNDSDTYFHVRSTENLIAGQIYTVGFYVTGVPSGNTATWSFPFAGQSNNKLVINIKSNGWCWGTGTIPEDIVAGKNIIFDDSVRGFYSSINISKFVIVKGKQKAYYTPPISKMSVNYANSAGSATKVIVNQHTTNDVNYPLVWSNQNNSNNVTENQLYKSWSDLYYNPKNKRLTVGGSIYAAHFYESSDKTLKKNIKSILSSTNIPKIREFDWKDTEEHSYGFIAQELEEQGYGCLVNEVNGKKTVNYTATLALTVAKLQNLINIQNKKISNLTKELKALKYGRKKNS